MWTDLRPFDFMRIENVKYLLAQYREMKLLEWIINFRYKAHKQPTFYMFA